MWKKPVRDEAYRKELAEWISLWKWLGCSVLIGVFMILMGIPAVFREMPRHGNGVVVGWILRGLFNH